MTLMQWSAQMRTALDDLDLWLSDSNHARKIIVERNAVGNLRMADEDDNMIGYFNVYHPKWVITELPNLSPTPDATES